MPAKPRKADAPVYAFPSRSRCPRCGSVDTKRYSQVDSIQYRECLRPTCNHHYRIMGKTI
jgi:Zn ribbon nucleic-acid-binding protein